MPVSITSEMSKLNSNEDEKDKYKINSYFRYFTSRIFILTFIISAIIIYFAVDISDFLVDDKNYYLFIIIIIIAAPFGVLYSIIESFLRSFQKIDKIVKINILTNIISVLILVPLVYYLNFIGVSYYWLIFGLLPVILLFFIGKKFIREISKNKGYELSWVDKRLIFKIGSISLLSSLMHQGVIIFIRKLLITNYGYEGNGIYQSVLSISLSYFALLYIFLTNYTLPKLSSCKDDITISSELNLNARFLLLIMMPMLLLFYGIKDYGILLLFSKNFLNARELLFPQFFGDIFRVGAALFGLWLIPRRKIKIIIIIDTMFNMLFLTVSYLFIEVFTLPLIYVAYAYMISFVFHFLMYFIYSKITLRFKVDRNTLLTFLYSILAFGATFFITEYFINLRLFLILLVIVIWCILVINRYEILQMKKQIFTYIQNRKTKL